MTRLGLISISALIALGVVLTFGTKGLVFLAGGVVGLAVGGIVTVCVVVFRQ